MKMEWNFKKKKIKSSGSNTGVFDEEYSLIYVNTSFSAALVLDTLVIKSEMRPINLSLKKTC